MYGGDTATSANGTFANPNGVCDPCAYDVQEFTVDTDGLYSIDAFYAGVNKVKKDYNLLTRKLCR